MGKTPKNGQKQKQTNLSKAQTRGEYVNPVSDTSLFTLGQS